MYRHHHHRITRHWMGTVNVSRVKIGTEVVVEVPSQKRKTGAFVLVDGNFKKMSGFFQFFFKFLLNEILLFPIHHYFDDDEEKRFVVSTEENSSLNKYMR